eukprot:1357777-Pleurochrysis_carterae.AAC.2
MTTKLISIQPANVTGKKYTATFLLSSGREKRVHFGAQGYSDYLLHRDKERRARYRARHRTVFENASIISPAALSWHILWGESTSLRENIQNYKRLL